MSDVDSQATFNSEKLKQQKELEATHRSPTKVEDITLIDKKNPSKLFMCIFVFSLPSHPRKND